MKTTYVKLMSFIAVFAILFSSCDDVDKTLNSNDKTVAEYVAQNPNLSILFAALEKTDLTNTLYTEGTYTVFAPTDEAFTLYLDANGYASIEDVETSVLTQILLNHVIGSEYSLQSLPANGYVKTLGKGTASATNTLSMHINIADALVTLNGKSTVSEQLGWSNIKLNNGILHIVDDVVTLPTIIDHVKANNAFNTLETVLTSTSGSFGDQSAVLNTLTTNASPLTLFAPANTAFTAATTGTGFAVGATASQVSTVLRYHVVAGNNLSTGLLQDQSFATYTTPAQNVSIDLVGGAKVVDQEENKGSVFAADIQCSNGVIHGVSRVLQPTL
ncbi:fasciclin domain-containing protein [Flavobacterium sp.]|uniref:fasciclin domain-containing protein n=1 Tax=Flavobacterium sp. TaxID=239 RepID=UPI0026322179|nr:fasciclin domain-containing protein [Flavobacterium sp.]